ncbi:neutral zinc metallopeptidase [Amycolatopsis umgeniensis]|uniref:Putative metalloprotease n=1 Tax=Amycolatopsis umgeniensis TaxID=336628 RepID=A0A841BCY8_9PSEU|nr:neutral zinc metallopeptidase [Amycolatopsis umgeniensis]MBB5856695.1 putative metalloprotease [Amycolatopsis umgeniensis]
MTGTESPRNTGTAVVGVLVVAALTAAGMAMAGGPRKIDGHALPASGAFTSEGAKAPAGTAKPAPKEVRELETNPLLAEGIALDAVTCRLPGISRDPAKLEAYYKTFASCLAEAWKPALDQANEPTLTAKVQVTLPETSACGKVPSETEAVAYYCGGDTTIYAPTEWMLSDAGLERSRHLATMAHEYGHHVQRSSGILSAAAEKMSSPEEDSPADKELVRRIELQANCFGALALTAAAGRGSISTALAKDALDNYGRTDDSDTHGTRRNQLKWAKAGFSGKTTAACNTWAAPASEVA